MTSMENSFTLEKSSSATSHLMDRIKSVVDVPPDQELKLTKLCKEISVAKGQHFIREGEVPGRFGFVSSGLFRYYYIDDKGREFTKGFFQENTFLSSYSAMILNRPSYFNIEALEDSSVVVIDFAQWKELIKQHVCWSALLISVLQKAFEKKEARERELLLFDAETRYTLFRQQYPGLEGRVRQHMIASYLGITNVALSRVRKKMGLLT